MPAQSDSAILGLFYLQLVLVLGPGVVALADLWMRSRRESKNTSMNGEESEGNVLAFRPSVTEGMSIEESEETEESRRVS